MRPFFFVSISHKNKRADPAASLLTRRFYRLIKKLVIKPGQQFFFFFLLFLPKIMTKGQREGMKARFIIQTFLDIKFSLSDLIKSHAPPIPPLPLPVAQYRGY